VRLGFEALPERLRQARFSDPRLSRDQYHPPRTRLRLRPTPAEQLDLLLSPNKRRLASPQRLEATADATLSKHTKCRHWRCQSLYFDAAQALVLEKAADKPPSVFRDHYFVGTSEGLQPGREVGRLADDRLLLGRPRANEIADDHEPGGDADARLQLDGFDVETADSVDDTLPGSDSPLCVVLMRLRVTKIDEHAVAHVLRDKTVERCDLGNCAVIGSDDLAQIFGIEPCGEFGRTEKVAEHDRQLSALGSACSRYSFFWSSGVTLQCRDRGE
jgi:hypothetical protein